MRKIVPKYIIALTLDYVNIAARMLVLLASFIVFVPFIIIASFLICIYMILSDINKRAAKWFDIKSSDFHDKDCQCHKCEDERDPEDDDELDKIEHNDEKM